MRRIFCLCRTLVFAIWAAPVFAPPTDPAVAGSELKAAFVYNFLQFTTWTAMPDGADTADLVLCAYARGALADALAGLDNKPLGARRIRIRLWPETPQGCRVMYLSAEAQPRAPLLLHAAGESAALTIAEESENPEKGVAISLFEDGEKLAFAINLDSARRSGITFSSKLLRLARSVVPSPEDTP